MVAMHGRKSGESAESRWMRYLGGEERCRSRSIVYKMVVLVGSLTIHFQPQTASL